MTSNTAIGDDDPDASPQSGIDDEGRAKEDGKGGKPGRDLTREEIAAGNDLNASVDQGNRSGKTSHGDGSDAIELGR